MRTSGFGLKLQVLMLFLNYIKCQIDLLRWHLKRGEQVERGRVGGFSLLVPLLAKPGGH